MLRTSLGKTGHEKNGMRLTSHLMAQCRLSGFSSRQPSSFARQCWMASIVLYLRMEQQALVKRTRCLVTARNQVLCTRPSKKFSEFRSKCLKTEFTK